MWDLFPEAKSRLCRKRTILEQALSHAKKKWKRLIEEVEIEGNDLFATVIDTSALKAELFGPLLAVDETTSGEADSSSGSWVALMCFSLVGILSTW